MTDTHWAITDADRVRVPRTTPKASVTDTRRAITDADRVRVPRKAPKASVTDTLAQHRRLR
ncbi:hypothetical protein FFT09_03360 [Saccharomonospora piscinae]|nr:hypothetical protein FFT09_03360 [Saccharomonospora piscinae]